MNPQNVIKSALAEALVLLGPYGPQVASGGDGVDLDSIDDSRLKERADEVLRCMRRVLDGLPRSEFGSIWKTALPPDRFFEVSDILYRFQNKSYKELAGEFKTQDRLIDGFHNRAAFPDGNGGYNIDDFGMKGRWLFEIRSGDVPANRFVLRTIDAVSRALNRGHKDGATGRVVFGDRLDHTRRGFHKFTGLT